MKPMKLMKRYHPKSTFIGSGSYEVELSVYGVDGVLSLWIISILWSLWSLSLWIHQLGIPLITRSLTYTTMDGQYKNHFIQKKREAKKKKKKKAKIMQNKKEDNAMHLENVKFKLCRKCKNATKRQKPSKHGNYLQGSNA